MTSHRDECLAKYNDLYYRFYHDEEDRFTCFYCGEGANCFDHQPPITRVSDYRSLNLQHEVYIKVPSCNSCNTAAANKLTETLWDRYELVKERLYKKSGKRVRGDFWCKTEGKNLKNYIAKGRRDMRILNKRLDYTKGIQAYADSIDDVAIELKEF